ncbi:C-C chemokine receptor type 8-like [Triplophysa dalaica]|uniref:C-C chemokine receptor type 8-like n=1 Tax=Triplophysa dalaica TaxID=1582913 RepID=UPI0024DFDB2E|nr:C-C chemokine receptor type 8-like [Triplophysa dalaica]
MNNSAVNFSSNGDSRTVSIGLVDCLEICVYLMNLLFSLPTHSYVMRLIVTGTGTGSGIVSEFFILNLSACEIGICLNSLIFVLMMWFQSLSRFEQFLIGFSITGRPLFQCLMCVERYLAVIHPVTFLKYKPLRYRLICCTAAWIFCLSSCFLCMFTIDWQYAVYVWFLTMQLLFFLFVKLFCLSVVLRTLKRSGPGERGRDKENHMKRRAFNLILITTVTTVLMFGPMTITGFYYVVTDDYIDRPEVWLSGILCFMLTGFVQPVLYLQRTGQFSWFSCKI